MNRYPCNTSTSTIKMNRSCSGIIINQSAGAGGSTFLVLEELHKRFQKSDLEDKKVLLIHAGGWSQRLPSASVLGKLFMPLPIGTSVTP